jgi:hypothetical protein
VPAVVFSAVVVGIVEGRAGTPVQAKCFCHEELVVGGRG